MNNNGKGGRAPGVVAVRREGHGDHTHQPTQTHKKGAGRHSRCQPGPVENPGGDSTREP